MLSKISIVLLLLTFAAVTARQRSNLNQTRVQNNDLQSAQGNRTVNGSRPASVANRFFNITRPVHQGNNTNNASLPLPSRNRGNLFNVNSTNNTGQKSFSGAKTPLA